MDLYSVIVTLVVVGVILWLINRFVPMADSVKQILNVAVVIILVLWLLRMILPVGFLVLPVRSHY